MLAPVVIMNAGIIGVGGGAMFKRASRLSFLIGSFLMFLFTSFASAQIPQIPTGLSWLNSSQTTTGYWPEVSTTEYLSTAAALDAIYALEPSSPTYAAAFQWMSGQVVSPTDYLSRRIIVLKRAGMDVSSELEGLLLYRNHDSGWGGETFYLSDILDTSLALQALKAANYTDYSVPFQAVNYLTSNQNTDGGWGFAPTDSSNVFVTAAVLKTLALYNNVTFNVQSSVDKAVSYLLSKQNTDGGFGSSPSTVYESALALETLIASGANNISAVVPNAVNYLTGNQSANGSWNDDP